MEISVLAIYFVLFVISSNVAAFHAPIAYTRCARIHPTTIIKSGALLSHYSCQSKRHLANTNLIEQVTAASTVILPALTGLSIDRLFQTIPRLSKLSGLGALITILTASVLSVSGSWVYSKGPTLGYYSSTLSNIYKLCWTKLLPASLSLWLIASTVEEENRESSPSKGAWDELLATIIPFGIGCIGSILGCILSFTYCCLGRKNTYHYRIMRGRRHYFFLPGHLLLTPPEAAVAAGCLCSAYIGGPWNYFVCMRILGEDGTLPEFAKEGVRGVLG